jgi:hypothetical protein
MLGSELLAASITIKYHQANEGRADMVLRRCTFNAWPLFLLIHAFLSAVRSISGLLSTLPEKVWVQSEILTQRKKPIVSIKSLSTRREI